MKQAITVYTQSSCHYCTLIKDWLRNKGIEYIEKNISIPEHFEEFKALEGTGTPFTIVELPESTNTVRGFDVSKLTSVLDV